MTKKKYGLQGSKLKEYLQGQDGYTCVTLIPYQSWCVIDCTLIGYVHLKYGCDQWGSKGLYRFLSLQDAVTALMSWTGKGDPVGPWTQKIEGRVTTYNPDKHFIYMGNQFVKTTADGKQ